MAQNHPFFSSTNMRAIMRAIELEVFRQTEQTISFKGDEKFITELAKVAEEYRNLMITSDVNEGIQKLNAIIVARACRDLIEEDTAGQYIAGNVLYKQTRKTGRSENRMGHEDPENRQGSAVILGGNVYKKRNEKYQIEQRELQNSYMNHPSNEMFTMSQVNYDKIEPLRD